MVLSQSTYREVDRFRSQFSDATPFRHVVIDDFFDPDVAAALVEKFPAANPAEMVNEFGAPSRKMAHHNVRDLGAPFVEIDDFLRSDCGLSFLGDITNIENLEFDPEYHGAGTHENFPGQGMLPHVDFNLHRTTGHHRRLNGIVYLNEGWQAEWGGVLELHSDPWNPTDDWWHEVVPTFNRCVLFETNEISWHGFRAVAPPDGRSRRSFTFYLYTAERPADEIAEKHSTVYVNWPKPEQLTPGTPSPRPTSRPSTRTSQRATSTSRACTRANVSSRAS